MKEEENSIGFRFNEEAIFNKQVLINDFYQDLIWISMLNKEWQVKERINNVYKSMIKFIIKYLFIIKLFTWNIFSVRI